MATEQYKPRCFDLESGILVGNVANVPDQDLIRNIAAITRAGEAAEQFANGYGRSFNPVSALKILELGLPDTEGRAAMNAELFCGAAIGTLIPKTEGSVGQTDLVRAVATFSSRRAMAAEGIEPVEYLQGSPRFESVFGRGNVQAGLLNGVRVAMADKIGLIGSLYRNREDFFTPEGVAAAAWLHGDARNPIARLVFDRNPEEIKQIDDGVKDLLAAVPARKVEEIVRGRVNAPVRPEMLVYWAAQWLHRDQSAVDHMPKQCHDGNVQPTDIFFAELSNDMRSIANHPL